MRLFGEEGSVVDLLDSVPLLAELLLHVDDHIVAIPLAAMLNILDKSVPDFANLDSRQNLRHLGFLDAVAALLEILDCLVQSFILQPRVRELILSYAYLLSCSLELVINLPDG